MLDFNHRPKFSEQVTSAIDDALQTRRSEETPRTYLGGSRLGVECDRALQYEFLNAPFDEEREFTGKTLRIFDAGHVFEDLAIAWLRLAGFTLLTENAKDKQFGFSAMDGRLAGHVDAVITTAPEHFGLTFPMLWECKSLNDKSWKLAVKKGVDVSHPVYASQMSMYQAYLEPQFPGLCQNPALFMAINKNTAELHFELVPFNGALAQRNSDRGVRIIQASDAHELLPRITNDPTSFKCKFCNWAERCWSVIGE